MRGRDPSGRRVTRVGRGTLRMNREPVKAAVATIDPEVLAEGTEQAERLYKAVNAFPPELAQEILDVIARGANKAYDLIDDYVGGDASYGGVKAALATTFMGAVWYSKIRQTATTAAAQSAVQIAASKLSGQITPSDEPIPDPENGGTLQ